MTTTDTTAARTTRPNLVLVVVGLGTLLGAMSGSMVNLALPSMGRDFGLSIETSRWVIQGFLVVLAVLMLPAGRLSDLFGHRRIYLGGLVLFVITSTLCGAAQSFGLLVGARLLQAVSGAMVMAAGPALLTTSFPPQQRGRVLGLLATATYTGLMVGPPVGGFIIASLGWRWTFYVNVFPLLILLGLGFAHLPKTRKPERFSFDWAGVCALVIGLPLVLFALSEGRRWGLADPKTVTAIALGSTSLAAFLWIELRHSAPLLDLGLFKSRMFAGATSSAVGNYIALLIMLILMPFFLEEGLGLMPTATGLVLSVQPLVMAVVTAPSGWLSDRIGSRGLATAGMLILSAGLFGLSTLGPDTSTAAVVAYLAVVGFGTGVFISPNSSALMGAAPRNQQGAAGSIMGESRIIGMLIGVAGATFLFQFLGGKTGIAWGPDEFHAFGVALKAATGVGILSALAAATRGNSR